MDFIHWSYCAAPIDCPIKIRSSLYLFTIRKKVLGNAAAAKTRPHRPQGAFAQPTGNMFAIGQRAVRGLRRLPRAWAWRLDRRPPSPSFEQRSNMVASRHHLANGNTPQPARSHALPPPQTPMNLSTRTVPCHELALPPAYLASARRPLARA